MKRILCIWFPNWPIQQAFVDSPELQTQTSPLALTRRDARRGEVVAACCRRARQQAVKPGMPIAEAVALTRSQALVLQPADPQRDQAVLRRLAKLCERYSPLVGLETTAPPDEPSSLYLELTGVTERWGGELAFAKQVVGHLIQYGYWPQLGMADTLGAAWAAAHYRFEREHSGPMQHEPGGSLSSLYDESPFEVAFFHRRLAQRIIPGQTVAALAHLPVAALRIDLQTQRLLHQLGIQQISQLTKLPRDGLATRLGTTILDRLDQAYGDVEELIEVEPAAPSYSAQWHAEYPTQRRSVIDKVIQHLCEHLTEQLSADQQGALQLSCRLTYQAVANPDEVIVSIDRCDEASTRTPSQTLKRQVTLFQPTINASHLWKLLQVRLENVQIPGLVTDIRLDAESTAAIQHRQATFWDETTTSDRRELGDFVDRLSNRLGESCVLRVQLQPATLPERAYRATSLNRLPARARRPATSMLATKIQGAPGSRPWLLLPVPLPIEVDCASDGRPTCLQLPSNPVADAHRFAAEVKRNTQTPYRSSSSSLRAHAVLQTWGPERLETGWWKGSSIRRDYYRALSDSGALLWIFERLATKSSSADPSSPTKAHRWFLHGYF